MRHEEVTRILTSADEGGSPKADPRHIDLPDTGAVTREGALEAEETNNHQVADCQDVVRNAQSSGQVERSPDEFGAGCVGDSRHIGLGRQAKSIRCSSVEEENGSNEI